MDTHTAYLKVVETCSQKGITPQEACKELNISLADFEAGSLLACKERKPRKIGLNFKKDATEQTVSNRQYYNKIQPEIEKNYYKVKEYLKAHPNARPRDVCPKFEISTTSYYKAKRILGDIKTPMRETTKKPKKAIQKKRAWQNWTFTPATEEKCRKGIELQRKDPTISNGDIAKKFGISKSSYYAYRCSIGIVDNAKSKGQKPRMPIKKTRSKKERAVAVQTIHYVPDEPKRPEKSLMEIVTKPKKQGMVIVGDVDFLAEFARKLQGDKESITPQ
jgi:ACT domain-containing protein